MTATNLDFPITKLEDLPYLKGRQLHFDSIAEMFYTRVQEEPDATHVLYYDQVITYAQTNQRANQVAHYLKEKGVQKGDVVSIMVLNSPETYYTMFGTQKLGAVAGAVNYMLKAPEIAYLLDDCQPKVAFVDSEFMKDFAAGYALAQHKPVVVEVVTGVEHDSPISETTLADILSQYPDTETLVKQNPDDPFMLLYSSGTTGNPKGILLSNKGQLSVCRDMNRIRLFQGNDIMMIILPMFHTNPLCVWTYPLTYGGHTICIRKAFSPLDFWPAVMQYGVTVVFGVPTMYNYIYNAADPKIIDPAKLKVRYAFSGAAPMPVELIHGFKDKFNIEILEGYGLTEVTGVTTVNPPEGKKIPGSVGLPYSEQEIALMDDNNQIMPPGESGEICVRSDANMLAYLNQPDATAETIKDGWLHTGDVGRRDEYGYLYIVDRKKDMINRGGENIYPREIEIAIEANTKVSEVAVIGVPDAALGEKVKAFIIPRPDQSLSAEEIKEFLQDKLAKYKIPEFIEITNDIPRNPTGKILKKELKEMEAAKTMKE